MFGLLAITVVHVFPVSIKIVFLYCFVFHVGGIMLFV